MVPYSSAVSSVAVIVPIIFTIPRAKCEDLLSSHWVSLSFLSCSYIEQEWSSQHSRDSDDDYLFSDWFIQASTS